MTLRFPALFIAAIPLAASACAQGTQQTPPLQPPGAAQPPAAVQPAPTAPSLSGLEYTAPFFPGAQHDAAIPTADSILGFPVGQRAATHAEIERCFQEWDRVSDRTLLVKYADSHEGRALYYLVITSPANMARIDQIKAGLARLADPRAVDAAEADRFARDLPAPAWLAYGIHGDETSGSDAALAVAHHFTAGTDVDALTTLEELIIIIDPNQNPDGRDRFLKQVREHRAAQPNIDDQSLLHAGYWPWGRANHYLFDLNRDWIFATQPETQGRVRAVGEWRPLLFVDSHEMGSQETFLFSPSREPLNPHFPAKRSAWWDEFAKGIANAFDRFGWRYYTGEWNEGWYPGYSDAWASFRGAVGMLYEQARIADTGVRRGEGTIMSYRESVHHQVVATMANLETLRQNRETLKREFLEERRAALSADGPHAGRIFAIVPSANRSRDEALLELMRMQGIEVRRTTREFTADATDRLGRVQKARSFPAGTLLVPNRQPEGHLLSVMLDFDPRMEDSFLRDERRELLRFSRSKLYDVSAWNITMLHDLDSCTLETALPDDAALVAPDAAPPARGQPQPAAQALIVDGADDRSVQAAALLMDRGVQVRAALKPFTFEGREFSRGSVLATVSDNRAWTGEQPLRTVLESALASIGAQATAVNSGLGVGNEAPDIGGENFPLLAPPRIALISRGSTSFTSYGAAWFTLDKRLGVPISHLDADSLSGADLRRYNVLILPDCWGESPIVRAGDKVKEWVRAGGTLIAIGASAAAIAQEKPGLSAARLLPDVLDKLADYEVQALREWEGREATIAPAAVWSAAAPTEVRFPWGEGIAKPDLDELKRRDAWQRIFMPTGGAMLAARVDDRHWLTFGLRDYVPVLFGSQDPLMAAGGVEAPIRLGVFNPAPAPAAAPDPAPAVPPPAPAPAPAAEADTSGKGAPPDAAKGEKKPPRVGWALLPDGQELRLRMSGLLWPEAAQRLANSAFVTREQVGNGQVILFATDPVFRAAAMGTGRVFSNAAILGPGLGARQPILP